MGRNQPEVSYWEKTSFYRHRDVAVVGAGIVGINAAIALKTKHPNRHIVVVDRHPTTLGASTRNAGFACFGSPSELLEDGQTHGMDEVQEIVKMRWDGLQMLRKKLGDSHIHYQPTGGHEIFRGEDQASFGACVDNLNDLNGLFPGNKKAFEIAHSSSLTEMGLQRGFAYMIHCHLEGTLHPGLMMQRLHMMARSMGVELLLGTTVQAVEADDKRAYLKLNQQMEMTADHVIIATNGFAKHLVPEVEVTAVRNHVIVTDPLSNLPLRGCFHYDRGYVYFRNIEDRILIGGARNRFQVAEKTDQFDVHPAIVQHLTDMLKDLFPEQDVAISHRWSGILGIRNGTKRPSIDWHQDRILLACGMGGMGISIGSIVGHLAANKLEDR